MLSELDRRTQEVREQPSLEFSTFGLAGGKVSHARTPAMVT